ncbi:PEP-CTERM sorting domain-containing protein, partial [bacterium]|nr:PEP-CTERM sorting domain-containing protein [bacterium]
PFDLGLLSLAAPVSSPAAATMIRFDTTNSILGQEATWVGHGLTGTGLTGAQLPLEFRAFTNIIDVMGPAYGLTATSFVSDFDRPDGSTNADSSSPTATRLEGNVASGDSGGGVFITVGGVRYLVGISSYTGRFGPGAPSSYGSISGATNLDLFHSWIFEQTGIRAIPEPAGLWLFCLAGLLALRRHR